MNQGPHQAYDRDKLVELFGDDPRTLAEVEREFLDTARDVAREIMIPTTSSRSPAPPTA